MPEIPNVRLLVVSSDDLPVRRPPETHDLIASLADALAQRFAECATEEDWQDSPEVDAIEDAVLVCEATGREVTACMREVVERGRAARS